MGTQSVLEWLASEDHPAARYLAARDLAGTPTGQLDLWHAALATWPPLATILALQEDDGGFPSHTKQAPMGNTFAAVRLMERCGLDVRDEPVARVMGLLERKYTDHGAVSYTSGGSGILPCYVGLVTRALMRMGAGDSPAVTASLDWIVAHQRYDRREHLAGGAEPWGYRAVNNYGCWESVSCYHGVVGTLGALAAVPADARSAEQQARILEAVDYLRAHRVYRKTHDGKPIFRTSLQFSLFHAYRSHVLDVLEWLADADPALAGEQWVREAIADVEALCEDGRVTLVANAATHLVDPLPLEQVGEPSRLLTVQWLRLRRKFGLTDERASS
ncbi:MAG: hypothetical protein HGA51_06165 [Demequinaceae bacterium]|nr:hypothetical protein [Demequinaceae bacterium]